MSAHPFEFEKALKELEEITAWFESSNVDLDTGLSKFERGMELASELKTHLASVENRVEKIRQRFSAETTTSGNGALTAGELAEETSEQTGLFGA